MSPHPRYAGMTYDQANEEGKRLIAKAHETGDWMAIYNGLAMLRALMKPGGPVSITIINQVPDIEYAARSTKSGSDVVIEIMKKAISRGEMDHVMGPRSPVKR